MTDIWLTDHATTAMLVRIAGWLLAGALLGALYFLSLLWNVRMLVGGRALLPLGLQLLRFAALAAALTIVTRTFGTIALLAAASGLVMARSAVLRWQLQP